MYITLGRDTLNTNMFRRFYVIGQTIHFQEIRTQYTGQASDYIPESYLEFSRERIANQAYRHIVRALANNCVSLELKEVFSATPDIDYTEDLTPRLKPHLEVKYSPFVKY